ncbi:MAG: response regulator [Cyclobacteriaceae bacterium]
MEKHSILLADDHRILLDGIKNLINSMAKFEVKDIATTGTQALELIKKNDYNILITDYEMPGLTGLELIKAFKNSST